MVLFFLCKDSEPITSLTNPFKFSGYATLLQAGQPTPPGTAFLRRPPAPQRSPPHPPQHHCWHLKNIKYTLSK